MFTSRRENTSCTLETVPPASLLPSPDPADEPPTDHANAPIVARRTNSCLPLSTSSLQQQLRYGPKYPCRRSVSFSAATAAREEAFTGNNSPPGGPSEKDRRKGVRAFRSISFTGFRAQRRLTAPQIDRFSKKTLYLNTRV